MKIKSNPNIPCRIGMQIQYIVDELNQQFWPISTVEIYDTNKVLHFSIPPIATFKHLYNIGRRTEYIYQAEWDNGLYLIHVFIKPKSNRLKFIEE